MISASIKEALNATGLYRASMWRAPFPGVAVLNYHAVRRDDSPAWRMAHQNLHVTAARLDAHCRVIRRMCTPITIAQFDDIATGRAPAPPAAVLVTFDDGYRSVMTEALPVLERWRIPAALFVCPGPIERQERFWFDVDQRHAAAGLAAAPQVSLAEWRRFIATIGTPAGRDDPHAPLSISDLQTLHRHHLFTIGAHTMSHPRLSQLSSDDQREEIAGCQRQLTDWLGSPVRWFAYPEGRPALDYTDETMRLTAEAGFADSFAVGEAFTRPAAMRFGQRRFTMLQSTSGAELAHRLAVTYPRGQWGSPVARAVRTLKTPVLRAVSLLSRQHALLLPQQAADDVGIAEIRAPYRVAGDRLRIEIAEPAAGTLVAEYAPRDGDGWLSQPIAYAGPATLEFDLTTGDLSLAGRTIASVSAGEPIAPRRFDWRFELRTTAGPTRSRTTSHYVVREDHVPDAGSPNGDSYADHEAESAAVHAMLVGLARQHGARGPVLEIGCATGGTLAALRQAGFDGYGIDVLDRAVSRATERLGPGRVWQCDPEHDGFPPAVRAKGPFGTVIMASVLEHFHDPFAVLAGLGDVTAPSTVLLIVTTNADSLGHRVFGADWEGYSDWSHHGVDQLAPSSLRARLPAIGWSIETLRTWHLWDGSADPIHASMRDWFNADARMRQLLEERELGDFITCVARRA